MPLAHFRVWPTRPGFIGSCLILVLATSASVASGFGRIPNPQDQPIADTDARFQDFLGSSLALSGNRLLVGAVFGDLPDGTSSGKAYTFVETSDGWSMEAMLIPDDGATGDDFGARLALEGDLAAVCAPGRDATATENRGAAYVFRRHAGGWQQEARLTRPIGTHPELFCADIGILGGRLFIGSFITANTVDPVSGAVVVFESSGTSWEQVDTILPATAQGNDLFGIELDIEGDLLAVGAPFRRNAQGVMTGSVRLFRLVGETWVSEQEVFAGNGMHNDRFGRAIDVSGQLLVVGAPLASGLGSLEAGTGYLFRNDGTSWQQLVAIGGAVPLGRLGESVAIQGDIAFLGTAKQGQQGKAVLVRSDGTWTRIGEVGAADYRTPDDDGSLEGDGFSGALLLTQGRLYVGASFARSSNPSGAGAVYVFDSDDGITWRQVEKLRAGDAATRDWFGGALAGSGTTFLVGARLDDTPQGRDTGSASVFRLHEGTWVLEDRLIVDSHRGGENFGNSVAIDGDVAVVGAFYEHTSRGSRAGAAYVFERAAGIWHQRARLLPPDGDSNDLFGWAVAVSGSMIAVSAPYAEESERGVVHVFERQGSEWPHVARLVSPSGQGHLLGGSLSMSGDRLLASVSDHPIAAGTTAGIALVFERTQAGWLWSTNLEPVILNPLVASDIVDLALYGEMAYLGFTGSDIVLPFQRTSGQWLALSPIPGPDPAQSFGARIVADAENLLVSDGLKFHLYERNAFAWGYVGVVSDLADVPFTSGDVALVGGHALCGVAGYQSLITGLNGVGAVTTLAIPGMFADGFE